MAILGVERREELEAIYSGINRQLEKHQGNPNSRALNVWLHTWKAVLEGVVRVIDSQQPILFQNLGNTCELMFALGDTPGEVPLFPFESIGAIQAWFGDAKFNLEALDLAEASALAIDVCSADKLGVGYLLKNLTPKVVGGIFISTPCDSQIVAVEMFREFHDVEPFLLDIPYGSGQREIRWVASQMKEQIKYMERVTGKKLNWDRLKAICEANNQAIDKYLEWMEWRKTVPCPQMGKVLSFGFSFVRSIAATPNGLLIASELAEDAKERALVGKKAVAGEERIRAIWFHDPIWWDLSFYDWMEEELGMVVAMDLFGYITADAYIDNSSQEAILNSLANKAIKAIPMGRQLRGPAELYIDELITVVNAFKADCAIFAGHIGCKHAWGLIGLLREALREADIPLLAFEYDMFDPRVTTIETLKEEFRRFAYDIMLPRKQKR